MKKRYRRPKIKDGELKVYYGKLPGDSPDIVYEWKGDPSMRRDSRLLNNVFGTQQPDVFHHPIFSKMHPSFLEELEARGYDLTTLKFSIMKKKVND